MFAKMRWRITLPFLLLSFVLMGGLLIVVSRPACAGDPACVQTAVLIAFTLFIFGTLVVGFTLTHLFEKQVNLLITTTQRLLQGDRHTPLPRQGFGELGEFSRLYSALIDQDNNLISHIQEERDQLSRVLVYMADGVMIADHVGRVRQINPAGCRLLATTAEKAAGHTLAEVLRHHELIDLWQRCQREQAEQFAAVEVGQHLFLQAIMTPYRHEDSQAYLVILQDLTTIRRLETVRRDFISNISHELRTPLASLRAVVETLQDGALADPPAAQRFLGRAEHEVDTLTQMVEELLELSRIESGRVPIRLSPTAVIDLVAIPLERFKAQAERDNIELILDLPDNLPLVFADANRVQQVINNLLHNALKFTSKGSITVTAFAVEQAPKHIKQVIEGLPPAVVICVQDTGVGIPAEDLARIFERFYKSDRARTRGRGGTGLGLAIARHIVQAHNGRLWAESKEGKGSTFYFSLRTA
jgi:two-component system, OmpR family, phosphate regulon sensor histidine kinase PhoR